MDRCATVDERPRPWTTRARHRGQLGRRPRSVHRHSAVAHRRSRALHPHPAAPPDLRRRRPSTPPTGPTYYCCRSLSQKNNKNNDAVDRGAPTPDDAAQVGVTPAGRRLYGELPVRSSEPDLPAGARIARPPPDHPRSPPAREVPVMKFRVERDVLADAAAWVARSLPARPPVPVLGGVLIEASAGPTASGCMVSGFDYETSARVELDATIGDPGRVLVSGRLLADITRALPSKPVDLVVDGSRATINCGNSRFSLPTMPVEDYPQLPAMPQLAGTVPRGPAGRGGRPGRGRRRPGRHAADAHRRPAGDRGLPAHARRHRPVPAGGARAGLDTGGHRAVHRRADPGPHAGRGRQDAGRGRHGRARAVRGRRDARRLRRRPAGHHPAAGRGVPAVPPADPGRAHAAPRSSRWPRWSRRSSAWRWSPTGSPRSGWSSARTGCGWPQAATTWAAPRRSCPASSTASR